MSVQPQQPNPQTIVNVQKREIDRLNDNRIYLMALIEEIKARSEVEIKRLTDEISLLKSSYPESEPAE